MATSSPPSPLYDHDDHGMHAHYQYQYTLSEPYSASPTSYDPPEAAYYYTSAEPASANSLENAHDASAVRLAYNQAPAAHPYYGDAGGAVPYAGCDYLSAHAADAHWHKGAGGAYGGGVPPLPAFYESGEVSPASTDDSSGSFYGSPHAEDARLVDERGCCGEPPVHACHAPFAGYGYAPSAAGYPRDLITAEQYSYPAGPDGAPAAAYDDGAGGMPYAEYDAHGFGTHAVPLDDPHAAAPPKPPARRPSPMAHLPYPQPAPYPFYGAYPYGAVAQPQPVYAAAQGTGAHGGAYAEATIAIPARRSPPLVEDTPKKPLTLACYFCRKRKIACGSPPPGRKDRTCNQCARRNLRCEYPVNSRRGTRQRDAEASLYSTASGYGQ